jgi:hypoxanthine phosphoribosyltransferase
MKQVTIEDKTFGIYIQDQDIQQAIQTIANEINVLYTDKKPIFISVLNGAFMFTADLLKKIEVPCELSFIKLSSYSGTTSTGTVKEIVGLQEEIVGRDVIVIEDIIDTGITMQKIISQLGLKNPSSIRIATLLLKPDSVKVPIKPDFVCFSIPDKFVVGYGLDLNGIGRNLPDIYQLI